MDELARPFQDAVQDALGAAHLPQHVHVHPALAARRLVGDPGLGDAAADRIGDQFLVALPSRPVVIDLRDNVAVVVV